jgi:hypothetical protein
VDRTTRAMQKILRDWRLVDVPVTVVERIYAQLPSTPEWKAEVERVGGIDHYMHSRELTRYFELQHAEFGDMLVKLRLAKDEAARSAVSNITTRRES